MNPPARDAVLLLHGKHRLLVEEELKKRMERIAEKGDTEFNLDVFVAGVDPVSQALQAAETLPFGSDKRYVVVKEAQELTPSEVKLLARYLEDPAESSSLILAAVDLKANSSLLKAVEKAGRVKELSLSRSQVPGWIRGRFKERGLQVTGKAIVYLQEALGDDLMSIEGAVEKVSLYHDGGDPVDLDEVVSLVASSAERSIYELVDRTALGDTEQALKILHRLLQQGEKPTFILNALSRRFRSLLLYHALKEEGRQDAEIVDYFKLPVNQRWMVTQKFKPQAARFDLETLADALLALVRSEQGIKSGEMDEAFALELAITSITAGRAGQKVRR